MAETMFLLFKQGRYGDTRIYIIVVQYLEQSKRIAVRSVIPGMNPVMSKEKKNITSILLSNFGTQHFLILLYLNQPCTKTMLSFVYKVKRI